MRPKSIMKDVAIALQFVGYKFTATAITTLAQALQLKKMTKLITMA